MRRSEAVAQTRTGATDAAALGLLLVEAIGSVALWAGIPAGWLWIASRIESATGSVGAAAALSFAGFVASLVVAMRALVRVDGAWVALRRRAGHAQRDGVLNQLVVASFTVAITLFLLWYYVLERAYVIPFMASR